MLFNVLFIIKMEIESKIASDFEYNTHIQSTQLYLS
jgi:hypothetical protein